jgi:hypothetical protein
VTAQKVFAAKLDGRDLAAEKKDSRRRMVTDRVEDLLEAFIAQHISQNRSAPEISRMLRREVGSAWGARSIHEITKRDVIDVVSAIEQRGAPVAANKALKSIKTFFRWCVGRAVLDRSPADGRPLQILESYLFSGLSERALVTELRKQGFDVADGAERNKAVAELWKAVDQSKVQAIAIGPAAIPYALTPDQTKNLPFLRNPRGGNLSFLRPSNPAHNDFVKQFGPNLADVSLAFQKSEIEKLARRLRQERRQDAKSGEATTRGRPSLRADVVVYIRKAVDEGKWIPPQSIKALTAEVNKVGNFKKKVSAETVGRALDQRASELGHGACSRSQTVPAEDRAWPDAQRRPPAYQHPGSRPPTDPSRSPWPGQPICRRGVAHRW